MKPAAPDTISAAVGQSADITKGQNQKIFVLMLI